MVSVPQAEPQLAALAASVEFGIWNFQQFSGILTPANNPPWHGSCLLQDCGLTRASIMQHKGLMMNSSKRGNGFLITLLCLGVGMAAWLAQPGRALGANE